MLPLLDATNEFIRWVDEGEARRLVAEKRVELLWSKRKVRALRAIDEELLVGHGRGPRGRHLSHNRETEHNPRGVWTLVDLKHHPGYRLRAA